MTARQAHGLVEHCDNQLHPYKLKSFDLNSCCIAGANLFTGQWRLGGRLDGAADSWAGHLAAERRIPRS